MKLKIKAKNVLDRQRALWMHYTIIPVIGVVAAWLGAIAEDGQSGIYAVVFGSSILIFSTLFFGRLLYEAAHPQERVLKGRLTRLTRIEPIRVGSYIGFSLVVESEGQKKRVVLMHKEKFNCHQWPLDILLREGEIYTVKFLSRSKLVTEIENVTHPELNVLIDTCFEDRKAGKKEKMRALDRLASYDHR